MERKASARVKRTRLRPLIFGIVAGVAGACLVALGLLFFLARGTTPLVTEESLAAALARWEQHGPDSYRLKLQVSGTRGGPVEVEVRNGEPVHLVRDGRTPARHTWDFWTVPGQLEAIGGELRSDPQDMFGVPDRSQVIMRAEFDPELGFPRKYQRQVLSRELEIGWETVGFEVLE